MISKHLDRIHPCVRGAAVVLAMSLMLSGCIGGCIKIPTITIPVTLLSNATVPGLPFTGVPINEEFDLPEFCNFPDLGDVEAAIAASPIGFVANLVKIESIIISNITFSADSGTFASFNTISMTLEVDGAPILIGTGSPSAGGTKIVLTAANPPNLYSILRDLEPGACLQAKIAVAGMTPSEPLTFDLTMEFQIDLARN
jgi:hypothetical protein